MYNYTAHLENPDTLLDMISAGRELRDGKVASQMQYSDVSVVLMTSAVLLIVSYNDAAALLIVSLALPEVFTPCPLSSLACYLTSLYIDIRYGDAAWSRDCLPSIFQRDGLTGDSSPLVHLRDLFAETLSPE